MYKYRITTTKNSTTEWYQKDPVIEAHLIESYINTEVMSMTTISDETSNDVSILIKEVTFLDEKSFLGFKADPLVTAYINSRNAYEYNNSIVRIKENIV